jgi:hypothetical protein
LPIAVTNRARFNAVVGQSAVALTPVDGESISGSSQSNFLGNGYYTRVGHTRARDWTGPNPLGGSFAGFDDPAFVSLATWLTDYGGLSATQAYGRMDDLGLNGMLPASGAINLADLITFGKWAVVTDESHAAGSISSANDPGVVGVSCGEEPSTVTEYNNIKAAAASWLGSAEGAGRFHLFNFADNLLNGDIANTFFPDDMVIATANQMTTCDQYWFAGASEVGGDGAGGSQAKLHSRLYLSEGSATIAECARGSHYGSMMDSIRKQYPANGKAPFGVWIEAAAPYTEVSSKAISAAQLKWSVWSAFVHGARQVGYFVHNFRTGDAWGAAFWDDHFGGPGVAGTGVYAAAKEVNLRALQIGPVINAPFDGYFVWGDTAEIATTGFLTAVTSTNARGRYGGVDASCRWHPTEQKHYILSTTREVDGATNIPVTYRMVDQGQTSAVPLFEGSPITVSRGGAIPAGFCEFGDAFATSAAYKAYRID